jgi:hypothetical protein
MVQIIEKNDSLAKQVKKIRWQHGGEEIETITGNRFIVRAGGSAARGVSRPSTIHLDELREMTDIESFASLRYTLMAAKSNGHGVHKCWRFVVGCAESISRSRPGFHCRRRR